MWSGLLTNEFGKIFAFQILNAHEQEPTQPLASKTMDLTNNQYCVTAASDLIKSKKFSKSALLNEFQKYVRDDKITILKNSLNKGE